MLDGLFSVNLAWRKDLAIHFLTCSCSFTGDLVTVVGLLRYIAKRIPNQQKTELRYEGEERTKEGGGRDRKH